MSTVNGQTHENPNPFDGPLGRLIAEAAAAVPEAPAPDPAAAPVAPVVRPGESRINSSNSSVRDRGFVEDDSPITGESWPAPPDDLAYYGLTGDIARVIEPHTEADPVALLVQFLVVFGSVIGRSAYFVAEGARHHTNLFAVMVGLTSKGRKGSSWAQVTRLAGALDPDWLRTRVQSGLSSGEGLIWAVRDPIDKQEPVRERGSRAVTGYQTIRADAGVDDKRLLAMESEFALVLKNLHRENNTLSAIVRQAWDSGELRTLTKNSPAQATGAHVSVVGHVTRDEVRRYMTETELANGFANRFLWVAVRRSRRLPFGGGLRAEDLAPLTDRLREAIRFAQRAGELARDAEADALWAEVYAPLSDGRPGLLGAVLGRAKAQTMRLACLYALLDRSSLVREEHLTAALALWRYCVRSAGYVFGDSYGDRDLDTLMAALRAAPAGLTRAEVSAVFGRNKTADQLRRLLARLLEMGLAHPVRVRAEGPGRPVERWHSGPAADEFTNPTN